MRAAAKRALQLELKRLALLLGRLPETADAVEWEGWRFEVVDLDGKRVDKVLAQALVPDSAGAHI